MVKSPLAFFTSPRRRTLSLLLLIVLGYSLTLRLDVGPGPFSHSSYIWDQILGLASSSVVWEPDTVGPHNSPSKSCFSASREKRRILTLSSDLPCDLVLLGQITSTCVYLLAPRSWLFSVQEAPSFNFCNSFVSHVQRWDDNLTAVEPFGNLDGRILAPNFCATISRLSNQFLVTFERLRYSKNLILSFSLSLLCVSTNTKILSDDHFSHL